MTEIPFWAVDLSDKTRIFARPSFSMGVLYCRSGKRDPMVFSMLSLSGVLLCAAFFLAGLVDAACGGGGLISIATLMMTGIPSHTVIGTNQTIAAGGLIASFLKYNKTGQIYWPVAFRSAPAALLGAILGARWNLLVSERALQFNLIILVPVIAVTVLTNKEFGTENQIDTLSKTQMTIRAALIGFVLGAYQGFYGAGSGTFVILAFVLFLRQDLVRASGTAKVMLIVALLAGAAVYIRSGNVLWPVVLPCILFNIIGGYYGALLAVRKGAKVIRPMFIAILVLLVVRIAADVMV